MAIADDEVLNRKGIRSVLEHAPGLEVAGEAADGQSAVELARRCRPDVLIADMMMSPMDGLATTAAIRRYAPATHVIMLAPSSFADLIIPALCAGVAGFLLKTDEPADLVDAVRTVAAGHAKLSPSVTRHLLNRFASVGIEDMRDARPMIDKLTRREQEVLTHLAKGMSNAQIARAIYLSESGVKSQISRLLTKLNCTNRVEAAAVFYNARLLG